ncbi:MAG TPA: hypothetical protein VM925_06090 [Labilithrix sp.]|jgi:hypothetical protein|nr:hypothetical protein [Labilithrix sp.]
MSRSATAYKMVPVGSFTGAVPEDDDTVFAKKTSRLEPFRLEAARIASVLHDEDDDAESTLSVSPEENGRLLAAAFTKGAFDEATLTEALSTLPEEASEPLEEASGVDDSSLSVPEITAVRVHARALTAPELAPPGTLVTRVSGVPQAITPETTRAVRQARELARANREAEARMRRTVLVIWGTAVVLAGLLAYFATYA